MSEAALGGLGLHAYRLNPVFLQAITPVSLGHPRPRITTETIISHELSSTSILNSHLRVCVRSDPLFTAYLHSSLFSALRDQSRSVCTRQQLHISGDTEIVPPLNTLQVHLDMIQSDHHAWLYWHRGAQRELAKQFQLLQRRRQENAARKVQGLPLLPEDDVDMDRARVAPELDRYDAIVNGWIGVKETVKQVQQGVVKASWKGYLVEALYADSSSSSVLPSKE